MTRNNEQGSLKAMRCEPGDVVSVHMRRLFTGIKIVSICRHKKISVTFV